jgi:DNA-binding GntR family transcriptional regulator
LDEANYKRLVLEKSDMIRINLNRNSDTPIYMQIKNQLRDMIVSGKLPAGHVLPPERNLSEQLKVNRATVVKAYHELKSDGLAEARVGKGTVVAARKLGCHIRADAGHRPDAEGRRC